MVYMNNNSDRCKTALVMPGGGARGAFQVGVLKALAELLPRGAANPFPVVSGTSAGAVNSIVLAASARNYRTAVAELERVWGNFRCHQVYKTDNLTMLRSSLHWLLAIVSGGWLVGAPRSLLNNAPLRALLHRNVQFQQIQESIDSGCLDAIAITAAGYGSARSTSFFQAAPEHRSWERTRRLGKRGNPATVMGVALCGTNCGVKTYATPKIGVVAGLASLSRGRSFVLEFDRQDYSLTTKHLTEASFTASAFSAEFLMPNPSTARTWKPDPPSDWTLHCSIFGQDRTLSRLVLSVVPEPLSVRLTV